ncbi:DUF4232 domain-containing protein [Streptomyces goshikiensis]|uniref:DUF4232 domain-containing protein n=1 Tax=Streptomyces goshikiensis TaxID=1942 RepID=UPI00364A183E
MRTSRRPTSSAARLTVAGAAVLTLALTACGGGGPDAKSAGPAADASSPAAPAAPSAPSAGNTAGGGKGTGATPGPGAAKGPTGQTAGNAPVCTTKDLAISAAHQGGPPHTHIVLTAKNTSGRSCTLKGYPEVQFLESHRENVPAVAKSKPAAPVVLTAGAPAYALVKLSDGKAKEDVEPVAVFSVTLQGGGMAVVKAPGGEGIAVDPAKWATGYWTHELRDGADEF